MPRTAKGLSVLCNMQLNVWNDKSSEALDGIFCVLSFPGFCHTIPELIQCYWGGPLLGVQKSQCIYGPENEIAAVTFFAKNGAALPKSNTFASVTEWQDSGEHGCWLKVSSPACMSPAFAKAPCCLELFGCCCRRLSQHGVGEVLIPLRHCWRDAFSVFALHCSVLFWSLDALFVFGLPPSPP